MAVVGSLFSFERMAAALEATEQMISRLKQVGRSRAIVRADGNQQWSI